MNSDDSSGVCLKKVTPPYLPKGDIYRQGYVAYINAHPTRMNPYEEGSREAKWWYDSWYQAMLNDRMVP